MTLGIHLRPCCTPEHYLLCIQALEQLIISLWGYCITPLCCWAWGQLPVFSKWQLRENAIVLVPSVTWGEVLVLPLLVECPWLSEDLIWEDSLFPCSTSQARRDDAHEPELQNKVQDLNVGCELLFLHLNSHNLILHRCCEHSMSYQIDSGMDITPGNAFSTYIPAIYSKDVHNVLNPYCNAMGTTLLPHLF